MAPITYIMNKAPCLMRHENRLELQHWVGNAALVINLGPDSAVLCSNNEVRPENEKLINTAIPGFMCVDA